MQVPVIVALASQREPKLAALRAALDTLAQSELLPHLRDEEEVRIITREIEGHGPAMPLCDEEMMIGAQSRAQLLAELLESDSIRADYYVGLEGGFHIEVVGEEELIFLRGWAYVSDGKRGYFGAGPSIAVPHEIADRVMQGGEELSEVIDHLAGERDVRSRQGTWGVLTRNLVDRMETFRLALLSAMAPFYNSAMYQEGKPNMPAPVSDELRTEVRK